MTVMGRPFSYPFSTAPEPKTCYSQSEGNRVADQRSSLTLEELRLLIRKKERELSELDLMLADYHAERSRLIRELRKIRARLCDAEEAASSEPI